MWSAGFVRACNRAITSPLLTTNTNADRRTDKQNYPREPGGARPMTTLGEYARHRENVLQLIEHPLGSCISIMEGER